MDEKKLIKINLSKIIRERLGPRKAMFLPGFILRGLEKLVYQERLNEILASAYPKEGSEFSDHVLKYLNISLEVRGLEDLPEGESFIFASNHPLGGLDGITLVKVLGERYGDSNIRVLVNDMLMHVTPLAGLFLPVNKYGSQGRKSAAEIAKAFEEGKEIVMFPAGLVSRLGKEGEIKDLEWQKAFVIKALEYNRRIVPVRFEALNSRLFYRLAYWRKRLGIKVNLEQSLLPSELCKSSGKKFRITFFPPENVRDYRKDGYSPRGIAAEIRNLIYEKSR